MTRKTLVSPYVFIGNVSQIGNGAHIFVPKEFIGKKVKVTIEIL